MSITLNITPGLWQSFDEMRSEIVGFHMHSGFLMLSWGLSEWDDKLVIYLTYKRLLTSRIAFGFDFFLIYIFKAELKKWLKLQRRWK